MPISRYELFPAVINDGDSVLIASAITRRFFDRLEKKSAELPTSDTHTRTHSARVAKRVSLNVSSVLAASFAILEQFAWNIRRRSERTAAFFSGMQDPPDER
jgi:hypothetical protein